MILAALLIVAVLGVVALAVDIGCLVLVRTQLQASADSAAMAAAAATRVEPLDEVFATAMRFAGLHAAGGERVVLKTDDVVFGFWDRDFRRFMPLDASDELANAVQVTTRRDDSTTGESPLFFARVLGIDSCALSTEAVAVVFNNFVGFDTPSNGENLPILPFALGEAAWESLLSGKGTDDWTWDAETGTVTPGPDGIPEVNLYPQETGASGNFGTVDIGGSNNSTADLARQILEGISAEDLAHHGGKLELSDAGTLELTGDPGLNNGVKDELAAICGKTRVIPISRSATGQGNNARFTITRFGGIRIMEVSLTGNENKGNGGQEKRLMVQRGNVVLRGGIPSPDSTRTSNYIYSPVCLVR